MKTPKRKPLILTHDELIFLWGLLRMHRCRTVGWKPSAPFAKKEQAIAKSVEKKLWKI